MKVASKIKKKRLYKSCPKKKPEYKRVLMLYKIGPDKQATSNYSGKESRYILIDWILTIQEKSRVNLHCTTYIFTYGPCILKMLV